MNILELFPLEFWGPMVQGVGKRDPAWAILVMDDAISVEVW